ncbi:hypothetical protein IPF37_06245 [bacterium]|nr:MAG: hypothetical protein IPF37_06245 [bacterium]
MPKQLLVTIADRINLAAQAAQANIAQDAMNVTSINTVMQNMKKAVAEGTKTVEEAQAAVTKYLAQMLAMPTTLATKVRKHNGISNYIANLLDLIENLSGQVRDANIRDNQQVDAAQKEFSDADALVKEAVADAASAAALAINTTVAAAVAPFMAAMAATQQKAQAQAQAQKPAITPAPQPAPAPAQPQEPQLPQMPQRPIARLSNINATA